MQLQSRLATIWILALLAASCGGDNSEPASGPSAAEIAAKGRAAFFDTLYGIADRGDEAATLLGDATARNRQDGKSFFYLGMLHMFRFSRSIRDFNNPTETEKREVALAQAALSAAVPLLPEDRRVPGFRAAATYTRGFVEDDRALIDAGLQQLRDAVTLYPEFNSFDFIGAVAPTVSAHDPLYQEVLNYVGNPLDPEAPCSPFNQPEICGNAGKAAHNVEGALVLFGDLFAKGGDIAKARGFYRLAQTPFPGTEGQWPFQQLIQERLRTVSQRVALSQDDDPTNDPRLIGYGDEACAVCHFK